MKYFILLISLIVLTSCVLGQWSKDVVVEPTYIYLSDTLDVSDSKISPDEFLDKMRDTFRVHLFTGKHVNKIVEYDTIVRKIDKIEVSFYSGDFHGLQTASLEKYNMFGLTCAAPLLVDNPFPFHTKIRVTNLDNGKSVVIRVNDRGPYDTVPGTAFPSYPLKAMFSLDLSVGAFSSIADLDKGRIDVKIEVIKPKTT